MAETGACIVLVSLMFYEKTANLQEHFRKVQKLFQDLRGVILCVHLFDDFHQNSILVKNEGLA